VRRWLKRAALALLGLAALWLLLVNAALNTPPLLAALNRRPDRFRIEWSAAWCVVPGWVHMRGLRLESRASRTAWSMEVDRAVGHIDLRALTQRALRVRELRGEGVRSELAARRERPKPRPRGTGASRREPWRFAFDRIELRHFRQLRFPGLRLTGDGRAAGTLLIVPGREVRVEGARLTMPDAQLRQGSRVLVSRLALDMSAQLGPYAPRQHPGLDGWDFLTASLTARGQVDELPLVDRVRATGARQPGVLTAQLRIERGTLLPGSELRLTAPGDGAASTLAFSGVVEGDSTSPPPTSSAGRAALLRLELEARGLTGGRSADRPPVLQVESLTLSTTTPETRVRGLVAAVRAHRKGSSGDAAPILADARATGIRLDAPSSRLVAHATLDRLAGRVDVGALLSRQVTVDGLEVDGAGVRFDLATAAPARAPGQGEPWAVRLDNARVVGLRDVTVGDLAVVGTGNAAGSFALDPAGTLQLRDATLSMPAGRLDVHGEPAAHDLAVELQASIEPVRSGPSRRVELIRATSGHATLRGKVASLAFLAPYLQRTPWLGIAGQGAFTADLAVDHDRFAAGSRLQVRGDPLTATLFSSRATGRSTLEVVVEPGPTQPRTALRLRFDRFGLADSRRPRQAPYLRGTGLRIAAVAPAAVDLTSPVQDFDATVDLTNGELPDLAVYDALLPAEAGLSLHGGRGRAQLHLQASTATRKASGNLAVTSSDARFRFQDLELRGGLALRAPLRTADLMSNRYDLAGARFDLEDVQYASASGAPGGAGGAGWWARAQLGKAALVWGDPLSLRGEAKVQMRDSGPLLALFAAKSRLVRWFDDALRVEGVDAQAAFRLDRDLVQIESLHATAQTRDLELRSRMTFSKAHRTGDLFVRYGRLAAGVALRDGKRDIVLRRPLEWFTAGAP